jgi:hypothetical protein
MLSVTLSQKILRFGGTVTSTTGSRLKPRVIFHEEECIMKKNVGSAERAIRVVLGLVVLSLAFVGPKSPWAYLGIIPLATGLIGWCPPYALFGISTCKMCK